MITAFMRVFCATTLAPLLCPGCQLHMSESCRKSSAVSKALSTAKAGDWAENVNRASRVLGDLFSIAMGAAQGSATKKSKQALFAVCDEKHYSDEMFPDKKLRESINDAIGTDADE